MPLSLKPRGKNKTLYIVGTLCGERIRESARTADRRVAEAKLIKVTKEIEQRAIHGHTATFTFAEAVEVYVRRANPKPKQAYYVLKLLNYWGPWRCQEITPAALMAYERIRHQRPVKNSTIVRAIYKPMTAILNMAAENGLCPPVRFPKPKVQKMRVSAAPEDHLSALLKTEMPKWLRAVVLTLTYHGTRPSDLGRLKWRDVSFSNNVITFGQTKNGEPHAPVMHPEVRQAYLSYFVEASPWQGREGPVFPLLQCKEPAVAVNNWLRGLCRREGLEFYSTHKIGRHAFASRILNAGHTLKETQQAGNWASITVCADLYGHLERSRVDSIVTGMRIGDTNRNQFPDDTKKNKPKQELEK